MTFSVTPAQSANANPVNQSGFITSSEQMICTITFKVIPVGALRIKQTEYMPRVPATATTTAKPAKLATAISLAGLVEREMRWLSKQGLIAEFRRIRREEEAYCRFSERHTPERIDLSTLRRVFAMMTEMSTLTVEQIVHVNEMISMLGVNPSEDKPEVVYQ